MFDYEINECYMMNSSLTEVKLLSTIVKIENTDYKTLYIDVLKKLFFYHFLS